MRIRRVVTGHDNTGRAVFVDDRELDPITLSLIPGAEYHRLWGGNEAPSFPDDGAARPMDPFFPPLGGYRFQRQCSGHPNWRAGSAITGNSMHYPASQRRFDGD